ncbi:MAG: fumarate hydratase [Clostridia bacterium]|nr:fumarate hydratase [Clostridia bacterium]
MREISAAEITGVVRELFLNANVHLPQDAEQAICRACETESCPNAKYALKVALDNLDAARENNMAICQDTGMAVLFAEIGCDVHITGGLFEDAVNEGVRQAYKEGYFRCSVTSDPLFSRVNTGDNTPAVIHTRLVHGDKITLTAAPKGFGSENMSRIRMFNPSVGKEAIINFVCETVKEAGGNPCPPVVLGIGIGGTFDYAAVLAKKALARDISSQNPDPRYAALEDEILAALNKLGIGAQGFGGDTTALGVNIEYYPTHIAGLPVAVNVNCHVARHATAVI